MVYYGIIKRMGDLIWIQVYGFKFKVKGFEK
jgi:hypothetical protein